MSPCPAPIRRISAFLNRQVVSWQGLDEGKGPTLRWIISFDSGQSAFLKIANSPRTAQWLRDEYAIYRSLKADFLAQLLGWLDDPRQPMMLLQDLSNWRWPPPWSDQDVQLMLETLSSIHRQDSPINRSLLESGRVDRQSWAQVRANPGPLLSMELCTQQWLAKSLPILEKAEASAQLEGDDLLHGDIKSGNICFNGSRCIFIDWNWACRGNRLMDIAMWLPSLEEEGGPAAEKVLPAQAPLAAAVAGNLASRISKPISAEFVHVRAAQRRKLRHALPWACRALGLPALDLM